VVYKKLNSTEMLIQKTTAEAPQGHNVLHRVAGDHATGAASTRNWADQEMPETAKDWDFR
jgi:hypothetical protein